MKSLRIREEGPLVKLEQNSNHQSVARKLQETEVLTDALIGHLGATDPVEL